MFDAAFARDGHLVIDRLFDPALVERVRDTVAGWTGPIDPDRPPPHLAVGERRLHLPVRIEGALAEPALWANPLLLAMLDRLFGGASYLIDNAAVVTALPGAGEMHLHADHPALFEDVEEALPPHAITLVVPLVATDAATGTTRLYSGSMGARLAGDRLDREGATVEPHVDLGGAFLMDYRLWHRGLANRSDRERPFLYLIYSRPWFTDIRNFEVHPRFTIEPATLAAMPDAHRHLWRRAAAAGLVDATIAGLDAKRPGA